MLERGAHHTQIGYLARGLGVALVPRSLRVVRLPGVTYKRLVAQAPMMTTAVAWSTTRDVRPRDQLVALARELYAAHGEVNPPSCR